MDLSKITLEDLVEVLADAIAARLGGDSGGPASETVPRQVDDGDGDESPNEDNPADEVEPGDEEEDDEGDEDLVTEEQLTFVDENFEKKSAEEMRTELAEFYEAFGDDPEDIANEVSSLKGKALTSAYKDYLARLVTENTDGEIEDFLSDWEEPYRATRLNNGEEELCWVKAGLTLTEDEVKEAGLPDPAEKPKPAKKKAAGRKKKAAGKKAAKKGASRTRKPRGK
ncbi:MAG: hypothetical protein GF334_08175 [Candidatus Altiarchaeales archaeon]|nr:hypothetical protein [Candidatus Altiarchaeales archaeon]